MKMQPDPTNGEGKSVTTDQNALDPRQLLSALVAVKKVSFTTLRDYVESNFRHVAEKSGLQFPVHLTAGLPATIITDTKRLQQVLKNLLSPERLLHETTLFLHRSIANLPAPKREMLERFYQSDKPLAGKQVLIVDNNIRNIFCLTSLLERHDVLVHSAATGKNAIEILQGRPGVDLILMDIMMPEIDGYDTMRAIREIPGMKSLPIIALTAKAMKGDREKCLEAGASDYIAKPVDTEQLVALLRVWLHRKFVRRANVYY